MRQLRLKWTDRENITFHGVLPSFLLSSFASGLFIFAKSCSLQQARFAEISAVLIYIGRFEIESIPRDDSERRERFNHLLAD